MISYIISFYYLIFIFLLCYDIPAHSWYSTIRYLEKQERHLCATVVFLDVKNSVVKNIKSID